MVGRNDPSLHGNTRRFHQYFAKIVGILIVYNDLKMESELRLFEFQEISLQSLIRQLTCINPLSFVSLDQQIPHRSLMDIHQAGLDFDTPNLDIRSLGKRWRNYHHKVLSEKNDQYGDELYTCKEFHDIREENMLFRSRIKGVEYKEVHSEIRSLSEQMLRLNHLRNRNELVYPYTSFAHEMRGEILVQLEKYNRFDEERQDIITRNNGWRVLGWSIKRDKELGKIEKIVASQDMFSVKDLSTQPSIKQEVKRQAGLSDEVMGHLEQFYMTCVSPLQGRTQALYGKSMELLYQYLSARYGKSFRWSMLNEESFIHFLSIWYLDQNYPSPVAAKVFLNTLKKLFRWLSEENISDVYKIFKRVYVALIRTLPITIEARKWLKENGVNPRNQSQKNREDTKLYQLTTSSSGPVVFADKKWMPIKLNGFPPMWAENIFWVRGAMVKDNGQWVFQKIENVYPFVSWTENQMVMSRP